MKKKRVNWLKIIALILTIIEICIVLSISKEEIEASLNIWRLNLLCIICIIFNVVFIFTKKK